MKQIDKTIKYFKEASISTHESKDNAVFNKILDAANTNKPSAIRLNSWRMIMHSRITKFAAAAVVAIALVPLTFGAVAIVKSYILGAVGIDQFQGEFKLSENIPVELYIGTKEEPKLVSGGNIRFFTEGEQLLGTLRCYTHPWQGFKWRTEVELLANGKVLNHTEHFSENGDYNPSDVHKKSGQNVIHFTLGSWSDVSWAQSFKIRLEQVPPETQTTPQAWVEAKGLDVLHGKVTGPNGKPIPNAVIQIREKRKAGQRGIAAPDVFTDKQGHYIYDDMNWEYGVGALVYDHLSESNGYRYQYKRLNKVLKGTQTIDFVFDKFPTGSAILSGKVNRAEGEVVENFTVSAQLKVDWKDYSPEHLYQFGYKIPIDITDDQFEISGLAPGKYNVSVGSVDYECMLINGQRTEISTENIRGKAWYGRVMFDDGTPAVLGMPENETQIKIFTQGYPDGRTIAKVNTDGYFTAYISDEVMERLKSGKSSLSINISKAKSFHSIRKDDFPVDLLSLERKKAGTVKIARPTQYHGRVLYENGNPAVPPVAPWKGAEVYAILRYTNAISSDGGRTQKLGNIDRKGYFTAYLTDEQVEHLKDRKYRIEIYHPSYENEWASYPIASFPVEQLTETQNKTTGYRIPFPDTGKFRNIEQHLESAKNFIRLGSALSTYCKNNNDNFPASLDELKSVDSNGLLIWAKENIEYLGKGEVKTDLESTERVLAFDKTLIDKRKRTFVMFADGRIEFCRPKVWE